MRIARGTKKPAPRQGCHAYSTWNQKNRTPSGVQAVRDDHGHQQPRTPCTPDGVRAATPLLSIHLQLLTELPEIQLHACHGTSPSHPFQAFNAQQYQLPPEGGTTNWSRLVFVHLSSLYNCH